MFCIWLRQFAYRGSPSARLCRRLPASAAVLALAFAAGGCTYQLESMRTRDADVETTGSIRPAMPRLQPANAPPDGDLAAARSAVSEALARNGSGRDSSMPWEDAATGARGTITPLSSAYTHDGTTCRDFLASYVRNGAEAWLQGEACRSHQGRWEVRQMRPWRRT